MVNLTASQDAFDCSDIGENTITITATDANGNEAEAFLNVLVQDVLAPTINCPDDITTTDCSAINYDQPTASDNCEVDNLELIAGIESGNSFPVGNTIVTYEASDMSGNKSNCSFEVFIDYGLTGDADISNPTCPGFADGAIDFSVAGGQPPYGYEWSNGNGPDNLPQGIYSVTVTDASECILIVNFSLIDPPAISVDSFEITHAMGGQQTGSIVLWLSGGNEPYSEKWLENGIEMPSFDPLNAPPGTYNVVITDNAGCTMDAGPFIVDNLNSTLSKELEKKITLFPNPTSGMLSIKIDSNISGLFEMAMYDVNGKMCHSEKIQSVPTNRRIDVGHLGTGVFWVKLLIGNEVVWKKLIIV